MAAGHVNDASLPPALPGFDRVSRSWDPSHRISVARIMPGEYYVTREHEVISTVLGSCVSACVRDPRTGVGGMNHFMLPGDDDTDASIWAGRQCMVTRYGIAAMENLINDILKCGARKAELEVKLFGGADVLDFRLSNVGKRNIDFVREFVETESMAVDAEDLGGRRPRKIRYLPKTGKVYVKRLQAVDNMPLIARERSYECTLGKKAVPGDIELFD